MSDIYLVMCLQAKEHKCNSIRDVTKFLERQVQEGATFCLIANNPAAIIVLENETVTGKLEAQKIGGHVRAVRGS